MKLNFCLKRKARLKSKEIIDIFTGLMKMLDNSVIELIVLSFLLIGKNKANIANENKKNNNEGHLQNK
jgi:hypothetical protein